MHSVKCRNTRGGTAPRGSNTTHWENTAGADTLFTNLCVTQLNLTKRHFPGGIAASFIAMNETSKLVT